MNSNYSKLVRKFLGLILLTTILYTIVCFFVIKYFFSVGIINTQGDSFPLQIVMLILVCMFFLAMLLRYLFRGTINEVRAVRLKELKKMLDSYNE